MRSPSCYVSVNKIVSRVTRKYGFTLYKYANVGNHLHLLLRMGNRHLWARFIRELTGRIAQEVQGLRSPQKGARFWSNKPFTRVVSGWGKAFRSIRDYVTFNQWEAEGYISRKDFRTLKELRQFWEFA